MQRTRTGLIGVLIGGFAILAAAQGPAPESGPGWTGLTEPEEVIEARRVMMIEVERQMLPVDRFAAGEEADPGEIKAAATTMEAMLLALPHLFPPTTDRYDPDSREPETRALPDIWQDFDGFLALNGSAETAVTAIIEAEDTDAMRAAARRLRGACDACHARFARPYEPPEVSDEDLEFDFESLLGN